MDFWAVILGAAIAMFAAILGQVIRGKQESALDHYKRKDNRQLARDEYDRVTLTKLQDAVNALSAATATAYASSEARVANGDPWNPGRLPEAVAQPIRDARRDISTLRTRLGDRSIRDLVTEVLVASQRVLASGSQDVADMASLDLETARAHVMEQTGPAIGMTYTEPDKRPVAPT